MAKNSVLYLLTSSPPPLQGTDAVFQEVEWLRQHFGGETVNIYPFKKPSSLVPTWLYGWSRRSSLVAAQGRHVLNHVYAPRLQYYPILNTISLPTVYTVTTSLATASLRSVAKLQDLAAIVVNNHHTEELLTKAGFMNVHLMPPGIDRRLLSAAKLELNQELHVLMASAPWEKSQFTSKGIALLLGAAEQLPDLRLTFLWRGLHTKTLAKMISERGLESRTRVIDKRVNINELMKQVHSTVLLARDPSVVKAYPHSLIESLICGKPVIISGSLAMADFVRERRAGVVVSSFALDVLVESLHNLRDQYDELSENCRRLPPSLFSKEQVIAQIGRVYQQVLQTF